MGKTISTHNGSAANREHNIRNPRATGRQEHIDKTLFGGNEILVDEKPREAYRRIFGEALDEYNAKQNRSERKIKDYYNHIQADKKKHPVYEMIVQIGDKDNTGIDAPTERAAIKEFIASWPKRNPNLELIGAYIHADERSGTLHAHVDYIPVAHGYKNGLRTQNGLVRALGEQGFETTKRDKVTAQIRWEARENKTLEEICNKHGIEVERPSTGRKHLDTPEYKELANTLAGAKADLKKVKQEAKEIIQSAKVEAGQTISDAKKTVNDNLFQMQKNKAKYENEIKNLRNKKEILQGDIKFYKMTIDGASEIENMGKEGLLGKVTFTGEEAKKMKQQAMAYFSERVKAKELVEETSRLRNSVDTLKGIINTKIDEIKKLREKEVKLQKMEKVIKSNPELKETYEKANNKLQQQEEVAEQLRKSIKSIGKDFER